LDIYIAMEESYKNGYVKGCEDTKKMITEDVIQKLKVTDQRCAFRYGRGHVFQCRIQGGGIDIFVEQDIPLGDSCSEEKHGRWIQKKDTCFCSECMVSGSPRWKRCPVCEAKMEVEFVADFPGVKKITIKGIGPKEVRGYCNGNESG